MAICQTKVVHAQAVADNVTHLKLAVPEGCQWVTGQFARIAMPSTNEPQWRCYSIASKAGADTLDFFIARVKGGAVSPRLCNLKVGETILLDTEMNGMLIESRLQPAAAICGCFLRGQAWHLSWLSFPTTRSWTNTSASSWFTACAIGTKRNTCNMC